MKRRPLTDGHKRLGWFSTAVFLVINRATVVTIPNENIYRFVVDVAAGEDDVPQLAAELKGLSLKRPS